MVFMFVKRLVFHVLGTGFRISVFSFVKKGSVILILYYSFFAL